MSGGLVTVRSELRASQGQVPWLRQRLTSAWSLLREGGVRAAAGVRPRAGALRSVSVLLVGDAAMQRMHHRHMGLATTTDVLTFELEYDARGWVVEGEIAVCVPMARRQARQRGHGAREELLLYAIHGLLHLLGFDDRCGSDYERMHETEDRLLRRLGVGPVFRADGKA